jgi:hypothetical protein
MAGDCPALDEFHSNESSRSGTLPLNAAADNSSWLENLTQFPNFPYSDPQQEGNDYEPTIASSYFNGIKAEAEISDPQSQLEKGGKRPVPEKAEKGIVKRRHMQGPATDSDLQFDAAKDPSLHPSRSPRSPKTNQKCLMSTNPARCPHIAPSRRL